MRARIRAGDREAFADLYEEYARAIYNHALRLTGDWSLAEEIMSDTFLTAWATRERLDPDADAPLGPWLYGIATNKAHNARRGLRRRLAFLARQPAVPYVDDFSEETAGRIDDARQLVRIHSSLAELRRPERDVIALCVWAGLDYAQAAEALGVPVGTVRSRLSRARAKLRRLSQQETPEPRSGRGEVSSEAAFAALPLREETR
ncbi:RNA polymerase sigma factor [Streptomyces sp. NBC_01446]|uniref:RNA polymerase sigma factor n=1 Tax=Streptomyces sp. NBC_00119 TaxID=2975659 RepID=A0AAU1UH27_9ACTN|nr:RNA polymerase sigma factor [Streptomyces sp. NBC_01446]MCX4647791.1 RNA polymerase sigma factor [Streptomyces sp. NBC_01446]